MFQILEYEIGHGSVVVIDDKLKTQYKGITGMFVWTEDYNDLRRVSLEIKIDSKEVLPIGFPAEVFSSNPFRNLEDCILKLDFPALSKIEGKITNIGNKEKPITIKIIFFIKL